METKRVRVNLERLEERTKEEACFGWKVASQDDIKPDHTVVLNMQRDPSQIDDYKATKKLEKQFKSINSSTPTAMIVFLLFGCASFAAYFVLKGQVFFDTAFFIVALTFIGFAILSLLVFIMLKLKRKTIRAYILEEAAIRSGMGKDYPTKRNIKKETDATGALANTFNNKK